MLRYFLLTGVFALGIAAGPLSKFDGRQPEARLQSSKPIGDIERCLIDLSGVPAPQVYRQPDRPDEVTILWIGTGPMNGPAIGKAELKKVGGVVNVTLWLKDKSARECAS
jgi:hypothetical protein